MAVCPVRGTVIANAAVLGVIVGYSGRLDRKQVDRRQRGRRCGFADGFSQRIERRQESEILGRATVGHVGTR